MGALEELLADDLERSLQSYADSVLARVRHEVPDLFSDPDLVALAGANARALLQQFVVVLRMGLPREMHAPTQSLLFGQALARAGVPLDRVLRAFRLGQEVLFERSAELARERGPADYGEPLTHLVRLSFRFVDPVLADVTTAFEQEREAALRRSFARREQAIHAILAGAPIEIAEAERAVGQRLDGTHHAAIAFTATRSGPDAAEIAGRLQVAVQATTGRRALTLIEPSSAVMWITRDDDTAEVWIEVSERLASTGILVATGESGAGVAGFVRSKQQADLARDVARLRPPRALTRYRDVALASVLLRDPAVATAFMHYELAELAEPTDNGAMLRRTVASFFAAGHDQSHTARELQLHRNTVARRLARAEELLGHPLTTRVRELEAALVVADIAIA